MSFNNWLLYCRFLAIPFVLELRTLMDWIWTDTTMAIGSWLTMEDIYANIYVLKCWREAEKVSLSDGFSEKDVFIVVVIEICTIDECQNP